MHVAHRARPLGDHLAGLVDVVEDLVLAVVAPAELDDVAADERPDRPVGEQPQPPVPGREEVEEHRAPDDPGEEAADRDALQLADRGAAADRHALAEPRVAERLRLLALDDAAEVLADPRAVLERVDADRRAGAAVGMRHRGAVAAGPDVLEALDAQAGVRRARGRASSRGSSIVSKSGGAFVPTALTIVRVGTCSPFER